MIVYGYDPVTHDEFPLIVHDAYGGAETAAWTLRVFRTLALRHRFTFWELLQMLKVATLGEASLDPNYVDPLLEMEELRNMMVEDAQFCRDHADLTLDQAVGIWRRAQRYCQFLARHHPSPEARARYAAEYEEHERAMVDAAARAKARLSS
jgi:hypothetical protein